MIYSQKTQDDSEVVVPAAGETFVAEDGTVSVVLADTVDDDYEPTQDEIEDFAEWMGMQLPEDKEFLYIAREGLKAPLPKNWRPCRTNEDDIYYFNFRTGESTWNHPMDDFFRQKFLKMKEEKKSSTAATPVVIKHAAVPTTTTGGVPTLGSSGGGGGPVSILKKPPSDLIGGMPGTATHAFVPALGASRPMVGSSTNSVRDRVAVDTLKPGTTAVTSFQSGGERRIVSEAEKNLEEKLRLERETSFKADEEKAEIAHEARLQEMLRTHAAEVEKLQKELEARRAAIESQAVVDEWGPTGKEREALEKRWRANIDQALKDEEELQRQLLELRERHGQRLSSEVARVEATVREQHQREEKQMEGESLASMKRLKDEVSAEFLKKKAALQQKSLADVQRLKEAAEKHHRTEVAAMREKHADREKKVTECEKKIASIRAKEREAVAAIELKSKNEQAAFRASMEAKLGRVREEMLCEVEGAFPVTLGNAYTPPVDDVLDAVRQRWQEEERKCMHTLEEERRKKLSWIERTQSLSSSSSRTSSTSSLPTTASSTTVCAGEAGEELRAANDVVLAEKEKSLRETEKLLRAMLEEELLHKDAPAEVQIAEALKHDLNIFVRSTELCRQLEREDIGRRGQAALAEHKRAKELYEKKVVEQRAKMEAESRAVMEEMMREVEQREVENALQAMTVEREVAERKLQKRYEDERRLLLAEVDQEASAYERKQRGDIVAQEEAKLKQREAEMHAAEATEAPAEVRQSGQQPASAPTTSTLGVPLGFLHQRLEFVEKTYAEKEEKLQAELNSIHADMRRLRGTCTPQGLRPPPGQADGNLMPDVCFTPALAFNKKETQHSSLFASEALRFLSEQQRELSARRGALFAAREEWKNNILNASTCARSFLPSGKPSPKLTEGDAVNSKLLTLVGVLSERLEDLTGCIAKIQTTTGSATPQRHEEQLRPRSGRLHAREKIAANKTHTGSNQRKGRIPREPLSHGSPARQQDAVGLLQKWSHVLLEFATPSLDQDEFTTSIQRFVVDQ
ncbi:hypothetical protein TCDM_06389 [Trypanosoma cruzi Dm28c]|uniref:WW domain-containing protein n=1 Tax=Trypanosoma cruzi Dm28c TaxID=1416333 RepID=V5BL67_TRYCR|nr:hypothetical protein TCDM_06389 [Trypanosoma cruzi Dm28c]